MATEEVKKKTTRRVSVKKTDEAKKEETATEEKKEASSGKYTFAIGRRKTAIVRVRVRQEGTGKITINGRAMEDYFPTFEMQAIVKQPLKITGLENATDVEASAIGGGVKAQSEAVRLGISRALITVNPTFRKTLKKLGYLMRDPRAKERKKPGL